MTGFADPRVAAAAVRVLRVLRAEQRSLSGQGQPFRLEEADLLAGLLREWGDVLGCWLESTATSPDL